MSGFEIAGLVLGGFPILYDAAKDARGRYKDLMWWWRFETEFEDFISAIDREFISFSQNQEILLSPLDIPSWEREILQNEPETPLWHEPHIQAQLRKRLQSRYYTWYMEQLHEMNKAISELTAMLPTAKVYDDGPTSLHMELFRVRTSFGHRKDELLESIKQRNSTLYSFLDRAAHVSQSSGPTRSGGRAWSFLHSQNRTRSMYECFKNHWKCSCPTEHPCGIGASTDSETGCFTLLFAEGTEFTELRVWVKDEKPRSMISQSSTDKQSAKSVSELKHEISAKNRLKLMKSKGSGIVALAASSLSIVGIPPSAGMGHSRSKSAEGKLEKRAGVTMASNSCQQQTTPPRRGRLPDEPKSASHKDIPRVLAVSGMCSIANGEAKRPFHGYLGAAPETRLRLRLDAPQMDDSKSLKAETLEAFLATTPKRNQRLKVGLGLIMNVLNLGVSPWVPENWSKMELLLVRTPTSSEPTPYISHNSVRSTLECKQVARSAQARASLFAIGVLLLELLFRQTLESLPLRQENLGNGGQVNEVTDLCTAIQWQRQVEDEFGDRLADAIRRCVLCSFEPLPDLSDSEFVRAVCGGVVEPLEEFLSQWNTPSRV